MGKKLYKSTTRTYYGREYSVYKGAKAYNSNLFLSPSLSRQFDKIKEDYHVWPILYDEADELYQWIIPCKYGEISEHQINECTRKEDIHFSFLSCSKKYADKAAIKLGDDMVSRDTYDSGDLWTDLIIFPYSRLSDVSKVVSARARWTRKVSEAERKRLAEQMKKINKKKK